MPEPDRSPDATSREPFTDTVGDKETRKIRARQGPDEGPWFWLGMFGLVGWSVAVPTLIGIGTGVWIDRTWPSRVSWTLMLMLVGVACGCATAWYWIKRESGRDDGALP